MDILRMLDSTAPESQAIGAKPIYTTSGFMIHIDNMSKKQKLSYIEHCFKNYGNEAMKEPFMKELYLSRGISRKIFDKCKEYGLHMNEARK